MVRKTTDEESTCLCAQRSGSSLMRKFED